MPRCTLIFQKIVAPLLVVSGFVGANPAWAIGTDAGVNIENTAVVNFAVNGNPQTPISSNTVQTTVDELIDVVVVDDNGGPVAVGVGQSGTVLQFTVTNNGNGSETFRIIALDNVAEGGFDPSINQLFIESNGVPGLQPGGDTVYVSGISDPLLAEDASLILYVQSDIPGGLSQGDNGDVAVRAVSLNIINETGTDDPNNASWPTPGTSFAGLGDGGGDAVVDSSHDLANLLVQTTARYQVSDALVSVVKSALAVVDPFGGSTLVPGSVITYQLTVTVAGSGTAENVVINDVLPAELEYQTGTILVDGVAEDDDFAPAGVDNSGFNNPANTLVVDRGNVVGGAPAIVITFEAAVR